AETKQPSPRGLVCARFGKLCSAFAKNDRDVGQGLNVVDRRWVAEESGLRGEGRLVPRLATIAFDGIEERRLFAADVGAGAAAQLDVELESATEDVFAQQPIFATQVDGVGDAFGCQRIFSAHIYVAPFGSGGERPDGHALYDGERIAFHKHAVLEGARL